ncbi:MAG: CRISPR-associated protein Cas4 [Chloroflexi bacterium UTCFX4]|nr:MAG: CRISPR-associated protein Cas4 [Chloroflexi bacterium UTCFX4]
MDYPVRVTDLKQFVYCPRVYFYQVCLPKIRPVTFKMEEGARAGQSEAGREERRSLRAYGIKEGAREFDVPVRSKRLGVRGEIDMVVTVAETGEVIPVDYKMSKIAGIHFQMQVAVYGMMLEEMRGIKVTRGFLYEIPLKRAEEVEIDMRMRLRAEKAFREMREILEQERMPPPVRNVAKCVTCEFRRFCNDVV